MQISDHRQSARRGLSAWICLALLILGSGTDKVQAESFTAADPDINKKPNVYGYIQFQVINLPIDTNNDGDVNEGRSRVQRSRLSVEGDINRYVSYELDIDPRGPEVTGKMRDAFFDIKYMDKHRIRLGQQKTPFGLENSISSSKLYFVNRSEMADEMARGLNLRDQGVSLIGQWDFRATSKLEYHLAIVNGSGMNVQRDNNKKKSLWGRVGFRGKRGDSKWRLGLSGAKADRFEEADPEAGEEEFFLHFKNVGTDFTYDHSRLILNGEFALGPREELDEKETVNSFYLMMVGKTSKDFGSVLRYDTFNIDEFQRWTVGAYYGLPKHAVRFMLNYEFRFEEDDVIDNAVDDRFYLWTQVRF